MIWKVVPVGRIVNYVKSLMCLDCVRQFTWNSVQYIGSFMGKAVRSHREIATKRLHRRKRRKLDDCKRKLRGRSSKCTCSKCTGFRYVQRKRVIEPDFLANLAYSRRVSRDNETSMDGDYNEPVGEISLSPGETWWNNVLNQRANMPPLYHAPTARPTRSEYSSATSGFRSATPDIFSDAVEPSRSVTPLSVNTDNSRSVVVNLSTHPREGSKSDSKILPMSENSGQTSIVGPRIATRSVSNNIVSSGIFRKEGGAATTLAMRRTKIEKRKKMMRSTSHGSDRFSTCAKCSRILSKAI